VKLVAKTFVLSFCNLKLNIMRKNEKELREALSTIAGIANDAIQENGGPENGNGEEQDSKKRPESLIVGCSIKSLPERLRAKAAEFAIKINPVNAPAPGFQAFFGESVSDPQALTVLTSKYWGPTPRRLTVSFMENTPANLKVRIVSHMNAWTRTGCISFVETSGIGNIRISRRAGGYWSYLGTDVLLIPSNRPTMNLEGFSMNTPESEFIRVVRHETGHTLGFPHEHMRRELVNRIDPQKAYEYFQRTQGWDKRMVDQQVLTPLDVRSIMGTPADQNSIMCYHLPGSITRDGQPILGGKDINRSDFDFVGRIYPKPGRDLVQEQNQIQEDGWEEVEDLLDEQIFATLNQTVLSNGDQK
jgi:hypothetical protein